MLNPKLKCVLFSLSFLFPSARYRSLQHDREDNQEYANPERSVELLPLVEDEHCETDAVERFQVVAQVYGEGGNGAQRLQLCEKRSDGEHRRKDGDICPVCSGRQQCRRGIEPGVERQDESEKTPSCQQFVQKHCAAGAAGILLHPLAGNGKESVEK